MGIFDSVCANMPLGILLNLKKKKIFHIFPLFLYPKHPFFAQKNDIFCIGNGIYDPKLTHFGQISAAQENHIFGFFKFVGTAGALVVIITV